MLALCIPFMDDAAGKYRPQLAQLLVRLASLPRGQRPNEVIVGVLERPGVSVEKTFEELAQLGAWHERLDVKVTSAPATSWRPSVARNLAGRLAVELGARELVFMDADCLPDREAFPTIRDVLRRGSAAILNKFWCVSDDIGRACAVSDRAWDLLPDPPDSLNDQGKVVYAPGLILGVRAADFVAIGGYDELLQPGEDEDLVERLRRFGAELVLYDRLAIHCGIPADYTFNPLYRRAQEIIDARAAANVTRIDQRWGLGVVAEIAA